MTYTFVFTNTATLTVDAPSERDARNALNLAFQKYCDTVIAELSKTATGWELTDVEKKDKNG
jgi:hypothetical protein